MSENTNQCCCARAVANGSAAAAAAAVGASNMTWNETSRTVYSSSTSENAQSLASASVRFRGTSDGNGEQGSGACCNAQTINRSFCITSSASGHGGQNPDTNC